MLMGPLPVTPRGHPMNHLGTLNTLVLLSPVSLRIIPDHHLNG